MAVRIFVIAVKFASYSVPLFASPFCMKDQTNSSVVNDKAIKISTLSPQIEERTGMPLLALWKLERAFSIGNMKAIPRFDLA